jgi:hypothetical protein
MNSPANLENSAVENVLVKQSCIHGLGVFTAREFLADATVLRIDDSRIVDADHPLCPELGELEVHCDFLEAGKVVLMPSPERHINSSCDPNVIVKTIDGVRHVIARRAIKAGDEICYDYIINCHEGVVWECRCGSERCRRIIVSSFFELEKSIQAEYVPLLDDWFVDEHREKFANV